jgi:LPXTG-motif cell wall-anchored protein
MLWEAGSYQRIVSLQEPLNDPLPLYFNVKIPILNGTVKIVKTATNGGSVKGWHFTVKDANGAKVGDYVTDATGIITLDLEPGTYTVTETDGVHPYWHNDPNPTKTVTVKAGETAKVTFKNQWIGKAKIIKTLANPEAGNVECWTFTITDSSGKELGTYKTDSNGVIATDLEPGTYTITEVLEEGSLWQCTTANPQTITVNAGSTAEVTFTNALRPGKLQVRKVDGRGEPLAGAELLLEWSSDGKTWKPITYTDSAVPQIGASTTAGIKNGKLITGNTGLIEFTGLYPTLSYRLTETNAPDGYQLLSKPVFVGTLPADQDLSLGFTVTNIPVFKLPETGSRSMVMTISGLVLCCIACVGVIYFLRRKEQ